MSKKIINYRKVIGFFPIYVEDRGNCTKVFTEDDGKIAKMNALSFLNRMVRYYFLDLEGIREHYGNILGIKHLVPIPFDYNIFIPIKYRRPRLKNDGAMGYLNIDWIEELIKEKDGTKIVLKDKRVCNSIGSYETTMKHYRNGYIVKEFSKISLPEEAYSHPATKKDIELLLREVNRIKDAIR